MKLRTQIFLSQLPIIIVSLCLMVLFLLFLYAVQNRIKTLFDEDLDSILAIQRMTRNLDQLNGYLSFHPKSGIEKSPKIAKFESQIEEQLLIQEKSVKGDIEGNLTKELTNKWQTYLKAIRSEPYSPNSKNQALYREIKNLASDLTGWNEDELVRLKEDLTITASHVTYYITIGIILSLILGIYFSWYLAGEFLRPLNKLAKTIRQMGLEDQTTLMHIKGADEINNLCDEFNSMTRRLEEFHRSSLGKLKKTHRALRSGFDSLPCPAILLDTHANIIYANKLAHHLSKQLRKAPSLFHINGEWKEPLIALANQAAESKKPYLAETEKEKITIVKDKKKVFLLPWVFPILKGDTTHKNVEGVLIVLQNLFQGQMMDPRHLEAYEAVAHEIKPLLVDLHMAIHLCLQQEIGPLNDKQEDILQSAREKCDVLEKLSQDLANISKTSQKKKKILCEKVDVSPIILKVIQDHILEAEEKKTKIVFDAPPYIEPTCGDPKELSTMVENLLRNAIYYATPKSDVTLRLQGKENKILLEVNNKGPIIPLKYRKDIFKKDFKIPGQKDKRAGLGLFMVKKIVDSLKGKIGVRSNSSQGTTFWVSLPTAKEGK